MRIYNVSAKSNLISKLRRRFCFDLFCSYRKLLASVIVAPRAKFTKRFLATYIKAFLFNLSKIRLKFKKFSVKFKLQSKQK